jgi:type II secretory pathway component PulK
VVSRQPRGEAGFALLTALLVLFLVSLCLSLLSLSLLLRLRAVRQESQGVILTALADAALAEAVANLAVDANFNSVPEHPLGSGRITSQVTKLSATSFRIVATARLETRTRTVEASVQRTPAATEVRQWRVLPPRGGG